MEKVYINDIIENNNLLKDRNIDINEYVLCWEKNGCVIFDFALNFMKRFGNSSIEVKSINKLNLTIITNYAYCSRTKYELEKYSNFINRNMLCIGYIIGYNCDLLIDDVGNFYFTCDEYILYVGNDFVQLINDMIIDKFSSLIWEEIEDF